jgi:diguanylate cyclase (GGDEF)-like protein
VARQSALAFANIRLRDSLRQQSIRDPLTGLFNRRYMTETLERESFRARRSGQGFTLLMADIDHFKRFNDQYGHEAGDRVLAVVARTFEHGARREDIVCRWGGEEFVWVQLGAGLENGKRRAEELLHDVRELQVEYDGKPLPSITLSFGVAVFPQHGTSAEEVLRVADEALYRAKAAGRNQVVAAELPNEPTPSLTLLPGGS